MIRQVFLTYFDNFEKFDLKTVNWNYPCALYFYCAVVISLSLVIVLNIFEASGRSVKMEAFLIKMLTKNAKIILTPFSVRGLWNFTILVGDFKLFHLT